MQEWRATADDGRQTELSLPGVPPSFAGSETVEYRTVLSDPRDPTDDIVVLTLSGLYARAEVDVEGRLDGDGPVEHDVYFRPLRVPFVPDAGTEVCVTCHAPTDRFGGVHDTALVPDEETVPGVWWEFSLESGPLPYLETVAVRPESGADGTVLRVRASVLTGRARSERLTLSVRPEGQSRGGGAMERVQVETDGPGRTSVEHTLDLRDPAPWWPRGFGRQNRHVLRVRLGEHSRTVTFGIRDVTRENGSLRINGESVPVRGVNLLDGTPKDIERAVDTNANLVRAHAHVPPVEVYEACDEAGVLVWQDLPLTGSGAFDTGRGRRLAEALARHTAGHPSVAVYAAHDDPVTVTERLGDGLFDRLRLRWRAWRVDYDPGPATELAAALPGPGFPAVGGPGLGCDAASYYPGWRYGTAGDTEGLLDRYPAEVVAEYGAVAPGPAEETATADGTGGGVTADTDSGTAVGDGTRARADDPDATRTAQAALLKTVTESLRRERVGAVAFCLRDAGGPEFGVYTRDGEPKPARDSLKQALSPVQAFLTDPSDGESNLLVLNDTAQTVTGTVRWRAGDTGGSLDVSVEGGGHWSGGPVTIPDTAETVELELVGETVHAENSYEL